MKRIPNFLAVATLAVSLAACGDSTKVDERVAADETAVVPEIVLTPIQQANYDRFNRDETQQEYGKIRDKLAITVKGDVPTRTASSSPESSGSGEGGDTTPEGASGLPARENMTFEWLDRNNDGKLSVAEYAIWKLPVDPNEPKRNDETKPYLTSDQINQAAKSFFAYDTDGTTTLSKEEFEKARQNA